MHQSVLLAWMEPVLLMERANFARPIVWDVKIMELLFNAFNVITASF
jgi:hypothetical protein